MESFLDTYSTFIKQIPSQYIFIGLTLYCISMIVVLARIRNKLQFIFTSSVILLLFIFLGVTYYKPPSGIEQVMPNENTENSTSVEKILNQEKVDSMIKECYIQIKKLEQLKSNDEISKIKIKSTIQHLNSLIEDFSSSNNKQIKEAIYDFPTIINKSNDLQKNH